MSTSFHALACPLDGLPLVQDGKSVSCSNNHNFDFDRKGTLNLLPVQFRKSKNPGDSKEMVEARRVFLDAGFYQSISDKLNEIIHDDRGGPLVVFDAGCGEGYYTERLSAFLVNAAMAGMDISKFAIAAAAKRDAPISWIVGTNAKIPVLDHSVDIVTCLFGFPVWSEFKRILKPQGKLVMVEAGPDHLIELRQVLYPEIKQKAENKIQPEGFDQMKQERLKIQIDPPAPEFLQAQIMMTPHGFRSTPEKIAAAICAQYEAMTLDIIFTVYKAAPAA
jgi:23S rRNA (guanine745-N1)-methyltransferase